MTLQSIAIVAALLCAAIAADATAAPVGVAAIQARLTNPDGGIVVVAHRGCHAAAPDHGFNDTAPENSLAALQRCSAIGADVMETDVRRAADGTLVMLHDATVDRTTDGTGKLSELTLADLQKLRLRTDEGGAQAPLTDQRVVTLEQMLAAAKGHILLNLDVKDAIYVQVVDAVTRAGMQHQVIVKAEAGIASPPLAAMQPFDRVYFFPILINAHGTADLAAIATAQTRNAHPVAFELPKMAAAQLPALAKVGKAHQVRLMVNSLWDGFIAGYGGDADAERDPDKVWGRMHRDGISIIQTDAPEALLRYRATLETR
ncbi:glycerophosphodiester phosphodiesterase family protein [Xanthomonas campestris pv. raphani]|uniref:glycerophosphodiester phosphodiesterase family protein n=1 Tax=Xanthomonas campestris TaxID=339 RepID=UPI001E3FBD76|nr:glycerophosphodiester phosphodiesterase family protein [Xanthomonas campestris]MCC8686675.1 glycerophosphodiester phosphodiesterase family protein [Xanthomonas campestris]MCC8688251.1 glycerophosphodiester phosphodiesterase family protein [Xanthomonas campestris]MCW2001229.1 glycerophosphoryl diester phosphodiesterase [Xanthomonas campestris]MEA9680993.1 glycerophosphodiester phosphodiesterase family protein [Xanthomonas campestris pv. raphani]MEA9700946.1 glycerophosphodiester phosphodiest